MSTGEVTGLKVSPAVIKEGSSDSVTLLCPFSTVDCRCDDIIWYQDNVALDVKSPRYTVTASNSLVQIHNVHLNDNGLYKCGAVKEGKIVQQSSQQRLRVQGEVKSMCE